MLACNGGLVLQLERVELVDDFLSFRTERMDTFCSLVTNDAEMMRVLNKIQ
jgi:hypothetical protein